MESSVVRENARSPRPYRGLAVRQPAIGDLEQAISVAQSALDPALGGREHKTLAPAGWALQIALCSASFPTLSD